MQKHTLRRSGILIGAIFLMTLFQLKAQNPIIQTIYTADPAPMIYKDTLFLYTGHDEDGSTWFTMKDWHVFSTTDMVNWVDRGSPLSLKTFSWATKDAWAGQCIYRNGKFYWYVPVNTKGAGMSIGVAVSDKPVGPFTDPLGKPLVSGGVGYIDPTVFIDDDGQAYLYWGNPNLYYVKLNKDMVSYDQHLGVVKVPLTDEGFKLRIINAKKTFAWARSIDGMASHAVKSSTDNKYYWYVSAIDKNTNEKVIGVAVGDKAIGPFTDILGKPLIREHGAEVNINPTVITDSAKQSYLTWGSGDLWYVILNKDMVSFANTGIQPVEPDKKEWFVNKIKRTANSTEKRITTYEEGPWLYKRKGLYYLLYPAGGVPEHLAYSTSASPTGPWRYGDTLMAKIEKGGAFTNHPGLEYYKGRTFLFYHDGALPGGGGFTRSVCVDELHYNPDGSLQRIQPTAGLAKGVGTLDPYIRQEAETIAWEEGVETATDANTGVYVTSIHNGAYIKLRDVDFRQGAASFEASVASASGGIIEIHADSVNGPLLGSCTIGNTGGMQRWETLSSTVKEIASIHDIYFLFKGGEGELFNFDWWKFNKAGSGKRSAQTVWLDQLDLSVATQGFGTPQKNKSVDGNPITIAGRHFEHGFGTHSESSLYINLDGKATAFTAQVGIDDEVKGRQPAVEFIVYGDRKKIWSSGIMRLGDSSRPVSISLAAVRKLELVVTDGGNGNYYDHADWADASFESTGATTFVTYNPVSSTPYILTPAAPANPRINGASVFGVRPGSPFQFKVAATGERPMTFSASGLPAGLGIDPGTGIISGKLSQAGTWVVDLGARNAKGKAQKKLRIVCGDKIALTAPMGWNSWNCFAGAVSEEKVKRAADAMVKSGLADHGWTYINVDDFWQNNRDSKDSSLRGPLRDQAGYIVANSRFENMKGLADHVHDLGLKAGLYSSPGPWTCGGCTGSYMHEKQDAETYAKWGFDYLKYDWCSYGAVIDSMPGNDPYKVPSISYKGGGDLPMAIKPYKLMGDYMLAQPRDIVFSLCQYGMSDVWKWGGSTGGNCWRTTNDINDTWASVKNIALAQDKSAPYAGPGNWNDPDMLVVGTVGWGNPHPSRLKPDEQYLHVSLWSLFSAPLLIGCDMEKLDDFTLNLLTNDEVIAIDQDPLGKQAICVQTIGDVRIYEKELEDGSHAVGFFNFGLETANLSYKDFEKIGLKGKQKVRDLWRQKDIARIETAKDRLPLRVPVHGVLLFKFSSCP